MHAELVCRLVAHCKMLCWTRTMHTQRTVVLCSVVSSVQCEVQYGSPRSVL